MAEMVKYIYNFDARANISEFQPPNDKVLENSGLQSSRWIKIINENNDKKNEEKRAYNEWKDWEWVSEGDGMMELFEILCS